MECLVTKLKGATNNEALKKFGVFSLNINNLNENSYLSLSVKDGVATIIGNGNFLDSSGSNIGKTVELTNEENIQDNKLYLSSGTYTIEVKSKYNIQQLETIARGYNDTLARVLYLNIDDLKYSPLLEYLIVNNNNSEGNIESLNPDNIIFLNISWTKIKGDISHLSKCKRLQNLDISGLTLSGDITSLLGISTLKQLNINYTSGLNITQEIVDMFTNQGVNVSWQH